MNLQVREDIYGENLKLNEVFSRFDYDINVYKTARWFYTDPLEATKLSSFGESQDREYLFLFYALLSSHRCQEMITSNGFDRDIVMTLFSNCTCCLPGGLFTSLSEEETRYFIYLVNNHKRLKIGAIRTLILIYLVGADKISYQEFMNRVSIQEILTHGKGIVRFDCLLDNVLRPKFNVRQWARFRMKLDQISNRV